MKTQQVLLTASVLALVALTGRRFVGFDGNVCAAGAKALGVVDADTDADNMAPANVLGVILVEAGAAITAGAEVQHLVLDPEGSYRDVQVALSAIRVDPTDCTAVDPPGSRLELADHFERRQLGCARHRAGREGRFEHIRPVDPGSQPAFHGADEVDQARVLLQRQQRRHADRTPLTHPTQVVADQVDDHDVLRRVLGEQAIGGGSSSLDGRGPHPDAVP